MPKPYPKEFRDEVVRVALNREDGVRIKDIAADFGITESCLGNWLTQAREAGLVPEARSEMSELREAKKRIRLLERACQFFCVSRSLVDGQIRPASRSG
jgi:transposase-like protein